MAQTENSAICRNHRSTENSDKSNLDEQSDQVKRTMNLAEGFACGPEFGLQQEHWISQQCLSLSEKKRSPNVRM